MASPCAGGTARLLPEVGVIRSRPMRSPGLRAAAALLVFSAWMALLFGGFLFHGALHLLLLLAAALFPWRSLPPPVRPD
jgi:hypothetical protein